MLKTLSGYIGEYRRPAFLCVLLTAMEAVTSILIPYIMSNIIDKGINQRNMSAILGYGFLMIALSLLSFVFGVLAGRFASLASSGFSANLRNAMYTSIQGYSFSNIDRFSTAGLITRLTTDVTNLQNAFQMIIRMCIRAPFILISAVVMSLLIHRKMSLIFIGAIVFLGAALFLIARLAMKTFTKVFKKYDALNESIEENVTAIRVVKSFVREDYEIDKFETAVKNLYDNFVKAESIVCSNGPVMMFSSYACMMILGWLGAKFIISGSLTTGQLTSLFAYVSNIFMSLMMLSMVFVMLTMSVASGERISEVLNEKSDITNPESPVYEVKDGSVDFDDVDFAYGQDAEKYVLQDVDLHIHSGETIGIIGGTGSGKSSLVNLISRLYDTVHGSVRVGGVNVRDYDLETLRNNVSVVLQTNTLFSGTIYDNLRWGNPQATEEECRKAAELACAHEFVLARPDGYDTWIEQSGSNVSGGQKQRLCIARALLKKPKILILDDSTSAVDTATDARIRKSFREFIPETTKIIISQRISSVKEADRILVLDEGRVNGFDTHENLYRNNEIYRSICDVQSEGNGDFDKMEA